MLNFVPWPTRAAWIGAAGVLLIGSVLSAVSHYHRAVLHESFEHVRQEAYRYNSVNGLRPAQIMLLGTSRVRHGVVESRLAKEMGPDWQAINLALDGAGLWEMYSLALELDPPKNTGPKIAIIEIHPLEFLRESDAVEDVSESEEIVRNLRERFDAFWPARQSLALWIQEVYYGWFAGHFPGLVPVPAPLPGLLWNMDATARRKAVEKMKPRLMIQAMSRMSFNKRAAENLRLLSAELRRKSFRVVLLETPSYSSHADAFDEASGRALSAAYQTQVLDPAASGADEIIRFRDAASLGATDDIFIDYGHLTPEGAGIETEKLALNLKKIMALQRSRVGRAAQP